MSRDTPGVTRYDGCYEMRQVLRDTPGVTRCARCYEMRQVLRDAPGITRYSGCYKIRQVLRDAALRDTKPRVVSPASVRSGPVVCLCHTGDPDLHLTLIFYYCVHRPSVYHPPPPPTLSLSLTFGPYVVPIHYSRAAAWWAVSCLESFFNQGQ